MTRVVFFLLIVGALSLAATWLADRPGDVLITWQGLRIETSLMVLGAAILVVMALLWLLLGLVGAVLRAPFNFTGRARDRRGARAYEAISSGLIAIGSGDIAAAQKHSATVKRLAPDEPLALLLAAQAAQLAGERELADSAFRAMASRADTKALGLRGLFIEAQRRDDHVAARADAEEAARTAPGLGWAGRALLEFRCATGDWAGALDLLERSKEALDKASYRRHRAVLLTARALAAQDTDRDDAKASALEAVKLEPTLVPAAALAGRMLAERGELRKASRVVAKAWRANPHPDLAETYAHLRFGDAARDRLARVEALAKKVPGHVEGALAVARAALDAREFAKARATLASHLAAPTRRIALLMAELERAEHNDEGRAREWMARALNAAPDPQWTADGHVSDRWLPVSPAGGRLDAFEWRVPLTGAITGPLIEPEPLPPAAPTAVEPAPPLPTEDTQAQAEPASPPAKPAATQRVKDQPTAPPVIPLVHAPDDPGPQSAEESEPPSEPRSAGWRKIFE